MPRPRPLTSMAVTLAALVVALGSLAESPGVPAAGPRFGPPPHAERTPDQSVEIGTRRRVAPFAYRYRVSSATWRSTAVADGSEADPETVYHGEGRVEGRIARRAPGYANEATLAYYPSSGGAGGIIVAFDLTNSWDERLEIRGDEPELRSCRGSDRERGTLRIQLRMARRSRRVVATYRVFDPHLQEHTDPQGRYCSAAVLPPPTQGRSVFDVSKFVKRRTVLLFEGHNRPIILGDESRSSVTTVNWGFAITLERRSLVR